MKRGTPVWDVAIRLFHWALVIAFALSAFSAFQDKFGIYANMHTYAGVSVLVLVGWRVLWGLVGSETARFRSFVRGPAAIRQYLKIGDPTDHVGHNPLGALSVVLMLVLLLAQASMGLFATDDMFFNGPFASVAGELAGDITELHEITGFTLMGLVGLHILVVLYYTLVRKADIARAMVTGRKMGVAKPPRMGSPLLALTLFVFVGLLAWYFIFV